MASFGLRRRAFRIHRASFHASSNIKIDVEELLATPTWSLQSLLPPSAPSSSTPTISSKQLHHLLRLSALPPPKHSSEEASMLASLSSHLHFVTQIRKVDASHLSPLQSLRDETSTAIKEQEIGIEDLQHAFANEETRGKYYKRIRRNQHAAEQAESADTWHVLGAASKKVGRYFVVDGGKLT